MGLAPYPSGLDRSGIDAGAFDLEIGQFSRPSSKVKHLQAVSKRATRSPRPTMSERTREEHPGIPEGLQATRVVNQDDVLAPESADGFGISLLSRN